MTQRLVRFGLALGFAVLVAAVAVGLMNWLWAAMGGGEMSVHGWIALGIGMIGTAGLAWGLMALAFHSNRSGIDAEVDNSLDPGRDDRDS
ncbi:hypothetical protein [Brevundimonas lutea]|uniref:hypothetical protein n=1 Tax=Brevundimonas lutea TaxID=2293980 RepID=UPI000F03F66A|nr:hypothetical protein [Brevundimonas lutea]